MKGTFLVYSSNTDFHLIKYKSSLEIDLTCDNVVYDFSSKSPFSTSMRKVTMGWICFKSYLKCRSI